MQLHSVRASLQVGEYSAFVNFLTILSYPVMSLFSQAHVQLELLDRYSHFVALTTCFRATRCFLEVTTIDDVIWGKYALKTPLKVGMNTE